MLVGQFAENLRQNVFQGHQAHQRAIFIHHQGEMGAPFAEGFQLFFQGGGVGHKPGRRRQGGDVDGGEIALVSPPAPCARCLVCSTPTIFSGSPRHSGTRV